MAGMMFACIQMKWGRKEGKGRATNLAVGNGREEEDSGRKRAKEGLSRCQQKVSDAYGNVNG